MGSIAAFPRTVEIEPAKKHMIMAPYKQCNEKSEFQWDPFQQFLGTLQQIASLRHSNLFEQQLATTLGIRIWCMEGVVYQFGVFLDT